MTASADDSAEVPTDVIPRLAIACQSGSLAEVRACLSGDPPIDVDQELPGGETALLWACRRGDVAIVDELIDRGADVQHASQAGQTPLMWAAAAGHASVVRRLIDSGVAVDTRLNSGWTAFLFAVRAGQAEVVEVFLDAGVDIHEVMQPKRTPPRSPRSGTSALMVAVENAHFDLAVGLVQAGADPNDQRSGFTPLHAVSWVRKAGRGDNPAGDPTPRGSGVRSSLQFVRDLVEAGADVNLKLRRGRGGRATLNSRDATPLLWAARTADLPLVDLLVELGADVQATNIDGTNVLMAAAGVGVKAVDEEPGSEVEVLRTVARFLDLGLDPNAVDTHGETAMHGAAYRNYPRVVEMLAQRGAVAASWDHKNNWGWTPVKIAQGYRPGSFKPNPPTINALLAAGGKLVPTEK